MSGAKYLAVLILALLGNTALAQSNIIFERDDRPVDGVLVRIEFNQTIENQYDVTLTKSRYNRPLGKEVITTGDIANGIPCTISTPIKSIVCEMDDRPVDGVFTKITAKATKIRNRRGQRTFDVTLESKFYDRINGREVSKISEIGKSLDLISLGL